MVVNTFRKDEDLVSLSDLGVKSKIVYKKKKTP